MDEPLTRFFVYQTAQRLYLVGTTREQDVWRLLKFSREAPEPGEGVPVSEDPHRYSKQEMDALLRQLHSGNLVHGGLQLVCQGCGLIGCFRFVEGFYLLLVTKRVHLGTLCGHKVYGIENTAMVPLLSASAVWDAFRRARDTAAAEQRYRRLLGMVQLDKQFFFSYTLPIWQTLQAAWAAGEGPCGSPAWDDNMTAAAAVGEAAFASDRIWNEWLSRPLRRALGHAGWVLPLAHGCFQQRQLALLGRTITLTLIARRSREFAGTRYRRRGVDAAGHAANDVETEQVLEAGRDYRTGHPLLSSVVQVRGSIPLFWSQAAHSTNLKPNIRLHSFDPLYMATRLHFQDLMRRYSSPVVALNLVKQVERRPRETLLGQEYATALAHINRQLPPGERVQYVAWDLSERAKRDPRHLLEDLTRLQAPLLRQMGLFALGASSHGGNSRSSGAGSGGRAAPHVRLQHGVLRTNCVDSLDRTNIAQFTFGLLALGNQLHALGISGTSRLDPDSSLARQLMDMFESHGHMLAQQYSGSEAHATFFQRQRGGSEAATQSRDFLTSVRRFYSNSFTDADKQDAISIFLGQYGQRQPSLSIQPLPTQPPLPPSAPPTPSAGGSSGGGLVGLPASSLGIRTAAAAVDVPALPALAPPKAALHLEALPPAPLPEPEPSHEAGSLVQSLSTVSLESCTSDGVFLPTLAEVVEGASPKAPRLLGRGPASDSSAAELESAGPSRDGSNAGGSEALGMLQAEDEQAEEEEQAEHQQPATPSDQAAASQSGAATSAASAPGIQTPPVSPPQGPRPLAQQAQRAGPLPRRSPISSAPPAHRKPKLESFDKMLSKPSTQVHHVRLTAAPAKQQTSRGSWLSPSKSKPARPAAGTSAGSTSSSAAASALAGADQPAPARLMRSNSDGNIQAPLPAASSRSSVHGQGNLGRAVPRRHVTFAGEVSTVPSRSQLEGPSSNGNGLLRHRTAPAAELEHYAASAASQGYYQQQAASHAGVGRLILLDGQGEDWGAWGRHGHGGSCSTLRGSGGSGVLSDGMPRTGSSSSSYHSLAALNLEGAGPHEQDASERLSGRIVNGQSPAPEASLTGLLSRRLPSLSRLRSLGLRRGSHPHLPSTATTASAGATSLGNEAGQGSAAGLVPALRRHPSGGQMAPLVSDGGMVGNGGAGGQPPLDMAAVVFGADAVRHGIDSLGIRPALAPYWLPNSEPLAAMITERQRLREQLEHRAVALATPQTAVEQRALAERLAPLLRPSWTLSLSGFAEGQGRAWRRGSGLQAADSLARGEMARVVPAS